MQMGREYAENSDVWSYFRKCVGIKTFPHSLNKYQ